jgi:phosphopantetheinyl transferase
MKLTKISLKSLEEINAPELGSDEVHLWCVAEAIWIKPKLNEHWTRKASREILDRVLSAYLRNHEPIELEVYGEGKPRLSSIQNKPGIHFNLSHSKGLLVIAITLMGEIGVDVEKVRPMDKMEQISERFYFESEQKVIRDAMDTEKAIVFFQIWTAKEAWAKLHASSIFGAFKKFELRQSHYSIQLDQQASYLGSVFTQNEFARFSINYV